MDETTHILVKRNGVRPDNHESYKAEDLYRADGLLIASRQEDVVRYGQDISTARNHLLLNEDFAAAFLRRIAQVDMWCQWDGVQIFERIDKYRHLDPSHGNFSKDVLDMIGLAVIEERDGGVETFGALGEKPVRLYTPGSPHKVGKFN